MLKRLYDWTLSLAARKSAEWWLGIISFVESSIFLVPAEALMVPMGLARPERAYRYALIASVGSVLGGIAGWLLGYYAYELVARPVLEFYGSLDKFELLRSSSSRDAILLMLVTSGVAHLPPMKVVTILSGAAAVDVWLFVASAIVARGGKFFIIAWLLRRYGEPIRDFIEKRLGLIALAVVLALVAIYFVLKMLVRSGT
jgi:membrane protein YqaA with SNARE-associated domain